MGKMYQQILDEVRLARGSGAERHPEVRSDDVWERIVKRLMKNEYQFDVGFYGSLNQLCEKISYFFHSSLQGIAAQPGAAPALAALKRHNVMLGLIADAQCFTCLQLLRAFSKQGTLARLTDLLDADLMALSFEVGARRPSERLFRVVFGKLIERGLESRQVLHVGSSVPNDIAPARRLGFRTALFAGDKASVSATNDQLNDPATRPDVLVTELEQLVEIVS